MAKWCVFPVILALAMRSIKKYLICLFLHENINYGYSLEGLCVSLLMSTFNINYVCIKKYEKISTHFYSSYFSTKTYVMGTYQRCFAKTLNEYPQHKKKKKPLLQIPLSTLSYLMCLVLLFFQRIGYSYKKLEIDVAILQRIHKLFRVLL